MSFHTIRPPRDDEKMQPDVSRKIRRLRKSKAIRALFRETDLLPCHLVQPVFVTEGPTEEIEGIPTLFRYQLEDLLQEVESIISSGVVAIYLFCHGEQEQKEAQSSEAYQGSSLLTRALKAIKTSFPDLVVIADIALEPSIDREHDSLLNSEGKTLQNRTRTDLGQIALLACEAGADFLAPCDIMDDRLGYLRRLLDAHDFSSVGVFSNSVKYASGLYGTFIHAVGQKAKRDEYKKYRMNPANAREALHECSLDEEEHVDGFLIKPALPSLDIISRLREQTLLPIGAYQVSGEWSMIQAASERGWLDHNQVLLETLFAMKRAGADFLITYGAKKAANLLSWR